MKSILILQMDFLLHIALKIFNSELYKYILYYKNDTEKTNYRIYAAEVFTVYTIRPCTELNM